jgi:transcriptional regulator with XRE-family HTH domain
MKESFGRVLRAKRIRAGLTQRQLAKASRIRPETISRLEAGRGNPTLDTLVRLMRVVEDRAYDGNTKKI